MGCGTDRMGRIRETTLQVNGSLIVLESRRESFPGFPRGVPFVT